MIPLDVPRLRFTAELQPLLGSTFQPTGFPDIGAAVFERFDDDGQTTEALLVESVQSMANRLEAMAWDRGAQQPVDLLAALPYVRVEQAGTGEYRTSSRVEAHRLTSAFVRDAELDGVKMAEVLRERLGLVKDTPLSYPRMAAALLRLDPFCLLHGVFFNQKVWVGQPRFTRAVSGVIEAHDVRRAVSGGRKSDLVRHGLEGASGGTSEGYGSIPFHRIEWTARTIRAYFVVDVELIRSYGLAPETTELLIAIALWEIRSLLSSGLRLRTACDLDVVSGPSGLYDLPSQDDLSARITELIKRRHDDFGDTNVITVGWKG
ncbi:type I-U CRISPR-associated RAMP protein Csb1/Cas7u [Streptosporangium lutulentum]|uniref:CRISPR-associated protein Csb1 n=1 Tax=Streptosporangium lutulentum TaxID=1461250 RepID=A0ABT9Q8J0_9ACTN|nr:type I-U CRISPR-associated RAMP protein Csb1/Cas7u [Streptosporangium lutulentum]MDP9842274.1 CRISPR-associated protein Csb1 [Streptosporangium lutulentum]